MKNEYSQIYTRIPSHTQAQQSIAVVCAEENNRKVEIRRYSLVPE